MAGAKPGASSTPAPRRIANRSKSPLIAACDLALIVSRPETPLTGGAFLSKMSHLLNVEALVAEVTR
jgi:RpiR family carbohydrate utilization transcriptional regulator